MKRTIAPRIYVVTDQNGDIIAAFFVPKFANDFMGRRKNWDLHEVEVKGETSTK